MIKPILSIALLISFSTVLTPSEAWAQRTITVTVAGHGEGNAAAIIQNPGSYEPARRLAKQRAISAADLDVAQKSVAVIEEYRQQGYSLLRVKQKSVRAYIFGVKEVGTERIYYAKASVVDELTFVEDGHPK